MSPASRKPGRSAIARAIDAASRGRCTGERRAPTRIRPLSGRHDASRSRQTRIASAISRRAADAVDELELLDVVDHDRHLRGRAGIGGQLAQGAPVRRRVRDDEVLEAVPVQPERLGEREREDARVARAPEDVVEQRTAADRLRRDADRQPRAAGHPGDLPGARRPQARRRHHAPCRAEHRRGAGPRRPRLCAPHRRDRAVG